MRLPLFIEVVQSAEHVNAMVCRKVMAELFRQKISPLPCATNLKEARDVIASMHSRKTAPSVFVINTFGCGEMLSQLDPLIGTTPTLFFYRRIFSEPAMKTPGAGPKLSTAEMLEKMTPRPNSIWLFGSQTSDAVAQQAAKSLMEFFQDGDFFHVERHSELQQALINAKGVVGESPAIKSSSTTSGRINTVMLAKAIQSTQTAKAVQSAPSMPATTAATPAAASRSVPAVAGAPRPSPSTAINGFIEQLGLASLLTMMEMEKKTGELVVSRRSETTRLLIKQGRIIQATADGLSVPLESQFGIESVYYLMKWTDGAFEFTPKEIEANDEINTPMTGILMEAARRADEPVTR